MYENLKTSSFKHVKYWVLITVFFFLMSLTCFMWQLWDSFSLEQPIDHAIWGQFGDFIGGILGVVFSLFSVILVVLTFHSQQKNAVEQRFNDMFFAAMKMFHEQEKELQFNFVETINDVKYNGVCNYKDFFDRVKKEMVSKFSPQPSFSYNRKEATKTYAEITIPCGGKLLICYRSLYRILDMLDHAHITDDVRLEYAKLLRAQFTENELLCLRYHIKFVDYRKFAYLVNKYNIMKHLPIFDMLEFNYWYANEDLIDIERKEIGNFFILVSKLIRKRETTTIKRCNEQIIFDINISSTMLKITCTKYPLDRKTSDFFKGIYNYDNEMIEKLLLCILKEIVVFSNFSCYNKYSELSFNSKQKECGKYVQIEAVVSNRKNNPIVLSFKESNLTSNNVPLLH